MYKLLYTLVVCVSLAMGPSAMAKSISDIWKSMPDSLAPYLNEKLRAECIDLYTLPSEAKVENIMKATTSLDTLSSDYLRAQLSSSRTIEMLLLPQSKNDSVVCVIDTYAGPKKESSVKVYSQDWRLLRTITFRIEQFIEKPDTMSEKQYAQLKNTIDHYFIVARWNVERKSLVVSADTDWTFIADNKIIFAMLKERNFEWKEGRFVEI